MAEKLFLLFLYCIFAAVMKRIILYYFFIIPVLPYFLDGTADNEYPEQPVRFLSKRTEQRSI